MKIAIAALALALSASAVHAADDFSGAVDWSGFYAGLHGGYGAGTIQDIGNPNAAAQDVTGWLGGVQAGVNVQLDGNVVLGVEVDASAANIGKEWFGYETNPYNSYYGSDRITSFGTLRGRLGIAHGGFLPYVTGGVMLANTEHTLGCDPALVGPTTGCGIGGGDVNGPGDPFESSGSGTSIGWTVGAGLEMAVSDTMSLKAEYLYGDAGVDTVNLPDKHYPAFADRDFETKFSVVRGGLNFRF